MNSESVLNIFKEITAIPRESGNEQQITQWLQDWAKAHNLESKRDKTGNVLIVREAAPGFENAPSVALQSHQDMVCEKIATCNVNFATDPIKYVVEDGWMIAKETTLGADDGIGIAASLALLADPAPTGRVECLFTISEETGMDGAEALVSGFFSSEILINLDSEDEGQLFIGCSGGLNTGIKFNVGYEPVAQGSELLTLTISGGIGGHSGDDINKDRMNAVQQMARFLYSELSYGFQLLSVDGGGKPNAIARECVAQVAVPKADATARRFRKFAATLSEEFHTTDPDICGSTAKRANCSRAIESDAAKRIITALFTCPHGVQAMSQDIPGLVQTSTNLASVKCSKGCVNIVTSQRSPAKSERRNIAAKVGAVFEAAGAKVVHNFEYPGWAPNVNSPILALCVESYRRLFNQEPEVKAIHAGLECGLFLEKFPNLDMISFGPTLRGVHAPGEKLELASLDKFVLLLEDVVRNVKQMCKC